MMSSSISPWALTRRLLFLCLISCLSLLGACQSPEKTPPGDDPAVKGAPAASSSSPQTPSPDSKADPTQADAQKTDIDPATGLKRGPWTKKDLGKLVRERRLAKHLEGKATPRARSNAPLDRPRTMRELPTTPYQQMMDLLENQVVRSEDMLDRSPNSVTAHTFYAGKLLSVAKVYGDLEDISKAVQVADRGLELAPNNANLLKVRMQANFALHRWRDAETDLVLLKAIKPDDVALKSVEVELLWNSGQVEAAKAAIEGLAKEHPSMATVARAAHLQMELGDVDAAEQGFATAETLYEGSSPVPVAWLYVQRGLLRLHSGRFKEAKVFYDAAVERAPGYPMAVEHLAEIEYLLGDHERAITLYKQAIKATDNPEFHIAIAGVYAEQGQEKLAKEHTDRARTRNLDLIKQFPAAMSGHSADFFLEDGEDAKIALELLTLNAKDRPNPTSFQALAEAQLANGLKDDAKVTIDKALATPVKLAEIHWTAARVAKAHGDASQLKRHKEAALALNPKIAVLEGDL